eukprot:EG_transcript_42328
MSRFQAPPGGKAKATGRGYPPLRDARLGDGKSGKGQCPEPDPGPSQTVHHVCPLLGYSCCSGEHTGCDCKCHQMKALKAMPVRRIGCLRLTVEEQPDGMTRSVAIQMEPWMALDRDEIVSICSAGEPGATNG